VKILKKPKIYGAKMDTDTDTDTMIDSLERRAKQNDTMEM
jgi:hypothetical protein